MPLCPVTNADSGAVGATAVSRGVEQQGRLSWVLFMTNPSNTAVVALLICCCLVNNVYGTASCLVFSSRMWISFITQHHRRHVPAADAMCYSDRQRYQKKERSGHQREVFRLERTAGRLPFVWVVIVYYTYIRTYIRVRP